MKIVNVKKLHNNVDAMPMPQCVMTGQVVVVYKVFEVNDTQFFYQVADGRDTIERSVVHSQGRGAAHCHKLIVIDCRYNTLDPTNIWKAQGSSIGRNYWREHYMSRIPRNFAKNRFGLIHRLVEERRRHNMQRKNQYLAISKSITKESEPINTLNFEQHSDNPKCEITRVKLCKKIMPMIKIDNPLWLAPYSPYLAYTHM